jgi:hypothetical protein
MMKHLKFGYLAAGTSGMWVGHSFGDASDIWDRDIIGAIVSFCMFLEGGF